MTTTYETLHFFGTFLALSYMGYFGVLVYAAQIKIRNEEDNEKYATGSTLVTMGIGCTIMIFNGQASQRMDPVLFMSLYALFNLYIWFIAYMYAPVYDNNPTRKKNQPNISDAEKERQKIMNEFYLSEMKDDDDEEKISLNKTGVSSSSISLKKKDTKDRPTKNPYSAIKAQPEGGQIVTGEKVDKVWDQIMKDTKEGEEDDGSDDGK